MLFYVRVIRRELVSKAAGRHEAYLQLKEIEYGCPAAATLSLTALSAKRGLCVGHGAFLCVLVVPPRMGLLQGVLRCPAPLAHPAQPAVMCWKVALAVVYGALFNVPDAQGAAAAARPALTHAQRR